MTRTNAAIAALIALVATSVWAGVQRKKQATATPDLTRRIQSRYQTLKTLSYNIEGMMTFKGSGGELTATVIRATVRHARPNRFVIDTTVEHIGKDFHSTLLSDGQKVWEWNPDDKRYTEKVVTSIPRTEGGFGDWVMGRAAADLNSLIFIQSANSSSSAHQQSPPHKHTSTSVVALQDGRRVYRLDYAGVAATTRKESGSLYFDTKDLLLRRSMVLMPAQLQRKGGPSVSFVVEFDYKDIVTDEPMEEDAFKFRPPDNATLAASMKSVLERATAIDTSDVKIPEQFQNKPEKPDPNAPPP